MNARTTLKITSLMVGPCFPAFCKNGGTCDNRSGKSKCACRQGYAGSYCEKGIVTLNTFLVGNIVIIISKHIEQLHLIFRVHDAIMFNSF